MAEARMVSRARRIAPNGIVERRCYDCREWLHEEVCFTIKYYRKRDGEPVRHGCCKVCSAAHVGAYYAERATNDPEWLEHRREVKRRSDRRRQDLIRMDNILLAERRGTPLPEVEPTKSIGGPPEAKALDQLPAQPLYLRVQALIDAEERAAAVNDPIVRPPDAHTLGAMTGTCAWLGIQQRTFTAWRTGERVAVAFDVVDRALARSPWLWWDVYNEQTVRHRLAVGLYDYRREHGRVRRERVGMAYHGDWGTDVEELARIEALFTSEEMPEPAEEPRELAESAA